MGWEIDGVPDHLGYRQSPQRSHLWEQTAVQRGEVAEMSQKLVVRIVGPLPCEDARRAYGAWCASHPDVLRTLQDTDVQATQIRGVGADGGVVPRLSYSLLLDDIQVALLAGAGGPQGAPLEVTVVQALPVAEADSAFHDWWKRYGRLREYLGPNGYLVDTIDVGGRECRTYRIVLDLRAAEALHQDVEASPADDPNHVGGSP
jgi:hypothetical protein